ncbi:glycosyltransferase family 4 protein [Salmonirosea aquatica]|uniref:Glycosyltransferase n=1 Tax=Salmonirosea aquatica TaxID=2654236 RepID=A0A7C9FRH3_9BACT|nr:glycosyltransferase [Cytophagaceae bacterium SJW1-29]
MTTKKRILFLQNRLLHYRIPLYEFLNRQAGYEVCVAFPYGDVVPKTEFRQIKLSIQKAKAFVLHERLYELCCEYDVVIAMFDIRWLTHLKLVLIRNRPFGYVFWGIGVSTEKGYDAIKLYDPVRYYFARRADAMIFYSDYPVEKYKRAGISEQKLFVAPNTVNTEWSDEYWDQRSQAIKTKLVFIGSLQARKNLDELLHCFFILAPKYHYLTLHIVGEGTLKPLLKEKILNQGMEKRIVFHGQVNQDKVLSTIFKDALVCVSPGQAGLSVLKSFSFGLPFITSAHAITGGERFAIQDDYNGFLYPGTYPNLESTLLALLDNPQRVKVMSKAACDSYWRHRTIDVMASGFSKAIEYAFSLRQKP